MTPPTIDPLHIQLRGDNRWCVIQAPRDLTADDWVRITHVLYARCTGALFTRDLDPLPPPPP